MSSITMKELMLDAIMGSGPNSYPTPQTEHLMVFTGNQHNPSWVWNREILEELDLDILSSFYLDQKKKVKDEIRNF